MSENIWDSLVIGYHTKLPELTVGDQKLTESPEALKSLVAVLLGGVLIDGSTGS